MAVWQEALLQLWADFLPLKAALWPMGLIVTTSTSLFSLFVPTPHPPRPVLASQLTPYNVFYMYPQKTFADTSNSTAIELLKSRLRENFAIFGKYFRILVFCTPVFKQLPWYICTQAEITFPNFWGNLCLSVMINGHVKILFAGTERTTLKAGSSINITWHLAYPHRGGFRLEVCYPFDCLIVFVIDVLTR